MLDLERRARSVGVGVFFLGCLAGSTRISAADNASSVRVRDGFAAAAVRRALPAVKRRLADPECRRVLADFADARGTPLQAILDARGQAPEDYLATVLFYDGSGFPGCAARKVLAITSPGGRYVFVCAPNMARVRNDKVIEALIIHEMLHTLGLGEDPPSSASITARVVARCGL